jgi:hypothetical protein
MSQYDAFTYDIDPEGSGIGENDSIHQVSPAWVLTFLRWSVRDTLRTEPQTNLNYTTITGPLVVENDCIAVSVSDSKSALTPSMSATLLVTDVNYETAVSPGDFVFVNMLNWESDARKIANNARNLIPINGPDDGFKGFFKIQSVRKSLISDPESGVKLYAVKITGFAFTEFNNTIYFNPYLIDSSQKNNILFQSLIGDDWNLLANHQGFTYVQDIVRALIESFIGLGITNLGEKDKIQEVKNTQPHFFIPKSVGKLIGVSGLTLAKDSYNYLFGIQQYSAGEHQSLAQGMNPNGIPATVNNKSRFIYTGQNLEGNIVSKPDYWNQVKVWSILNQFTNSPMNELYTCFRIAPNGSVMPTVVFRQIPFTTSDFEPGNYKVTKFMTLPRWNINPALAQSFDLGRDEAARINFVQYFGRSTIGPEGYSISEEIAKGNYIYDEDDVKRNGLRPYIVSTQFDEPSEKDKKGEFRSPGWAKIVGDALIGGHLKFSGTINFVGIVEPIPVGDNLEFDGVVYHIEQITHTCVMNPQSGKKTFETTIVVSNGLSINSSQDGVEYSEMAFGSGYASRTDDYKNEQLLPGISESQDTIYRNPSVDTPHADPSSFAQPDTNTFITETNPNKA